MKHIIFLIYVTNLNIYLFAPAQLNEISAWIDGTLFYGGNKAWTDALRAFEGGRLRSLNDSDSRAKDFPAKNDIRLPMANPPPPRNHRLKPIKRFWSEL